MVNRKELLEELHFLRVGVAPILGDRVLGEQLLTKSLVQRRGVRSDICGWFSRRLPAVSSLSTAS